MTQSKKQKVIMTAEVRIDSKKIAEATVEQYSLRKAARGPSSLAEDDEEAPEGAPKLETPEDPAEPPMVFGATDATATDSAPDIVELDTGIATSLATRISAFGPAPVSTTATDYGVGTSPMVRPNVFSPDTTLGETDSPSPGY